MASTRKHGIDTQTLDQHPNFVLTPEQHIITQNCMNSQKMHQNPNIAVIPKHIIKTLHQHPNLHQYQNSASTPDHWNNTTILHEYLPSVSTSEH